MDLYCRMFSIFITLKVGSVCDLIWPIPSIQGQETLRVFNLQIAAIKGHMELYHKVQIHYMCIKKGTLDTQMMKKRVVLKQFSKHSSHP